MNAIENQPAGTKCAKRSSFKALLAAIEPLESRILLTAVVVNTVVDEIDATDSPTVSLRDAIAMADSSTTPTTITFDPVVFAAARTIVLNGTQLELSNTSEPTTIIGPAAGVTISGDNASRVLLIDESVTATISGATIANGSAFAPGDPDWGAGIDNGGVLSLSNVTISDNSAGYVGGGIYNSLYAGVLTLTDVTIDKNSCAVQGGGLFNDGNAVLTNVTISGNNAPQGGAVWGNFHSSVTTALSNVTASGNTAVSDGGGIENDGAATQFTLDDTIVAGNTVTGSGAVGPDVAGSFTSQGFNLIGDSSDGTGFSTQDLTGSAASPLNPQLGPLANNGGPTQTLLPLAGSPAIGAGSVALIPAGITTDQRGLPRVVGGQVDIGAVEAQAAGSADPTFNGGNPVSVGFAAQASAVTGGGQTLLVGVEPGTTAGSTQAVLEQLNADGSTDPTFGSSGTVTDAATGEEAFYGVVTESDGTIVAAGASNGDLLLAGYNTDGSVDTSFGASGRVVVPIAGATDATAYGITTDANGDLVVVGSAGGQFLADRFTAAGAQDPAFNGGGPLLFGSASDGDVLGNVAVESAANGSGIVAAGASAGSVVVVQLTPGGALDSGFGTGGIVSVSALAAPDLNSNQPNQTEGIALDPAGSIVVANTTSGGDFATARLTGAGALDTTFGSGGIVTTSFGSGTADADFVGVQPDGSQILVAGTYTVNGGVQQAIAAYTPQGNLDTTFGTGGMELLSTGLSAAPALTEPSGKITPQALGLGGAYIEEIFGNLNGGKLLLGVGQPGSATATAAIRRLIAPAPTPAPTPTPTPLPSGTLEVSVSASLPAAVVGGAKVKSSATVTVSNPTDQLVSGPATVTLLVSTAQSLDGATQLLHVTEKLKLKAGAHEVFRIKLSSFPATLPKGSYYIVATVKASDGTITGASVATPSLSIAPPFVTIKTANVAGSPASIAPGKKLTLSLTLQNSGNVQAAGTAALTVSLSTSSTGAGGTTVATTPLRVKLKAGKSGVYRVKLAVPAGTAAGSYYLAASLAVSALGDLTAADGMAVSATPISVT